MYSAYSNEFFDNIKVWNNSVIEKNKDILLKTSSTMGELIYLFGEKNTKLIFPEQNTYLSSSFDEEDVKVDADLSVGNY